MDGLGSRRVKDDARALRKDIRILLLNPNNPMRSWFVHDACSLAVRLPDFPLAAVAPDAHRAGVNLKEINGILELIGESALSSRASLVHDHSRN